MTHACVKPITIGNCELKNRIFFAPTTLGLKPEEKAAKLNAIAQGQTALIMDGAQAAQVPKLEVHLD